MLTKKERKIIERLNHPIYTVAYVEDCVKKIATDTGDPQSFVLKQRALGFYDAVKSISTTFLEGE